MSKKNLTLLIIPIIFVGCTISPYKKGDIGWHKYYNHKEKGWLKSSDPFVIEATSVCSEKAYGDGLNVNGKIVKDGHELSKIYYRDVFKFGKKVYGKYKREPTLNEAISEADHFVNNSPDYFVDLARKKRIWVDCFYDDYEFYTNTKRLPYHVPTGELLRYDREKHKFYSRKPNAAAL